MRHHPQPWWFRLALLLCPNRCREIPEAQNPDRIVLRQVALWGRYAYLQQFASGEDPRYMHSHQWYRTIAIGLYGSYLERRLAGPDKVRRAPYFYTMGADVVHQVLDPAPGHTSIFIGLYRNDNLKHYYGAPQDASIVYAYRLGQPITLRRLWSDHIKVMVRRI